MWTSNCNSEAQFAGSIWLQWRRMKPVTSNVYFFLFKMSVNDNSGWIHPPHSPNKNDYYEFISLVFIILCVAWGTITCVYTSFSNYLTAVQYSSKCTLIHDTTVDKLSKVMVIWAVATLVYMLLQKCLSGHNNLYVPCCSVITWF